MVSENINCKICNGSYTTLTTLAHTKGKKHLKAVRQNNIKLSEAELRLEGIRKIIREYQAVECQLDFKVFYYKRKIKNDL